MGTVKDPVQKKETTAQTHEQEGEKTTAGASKTPPSFAVGAGPVQKKEAAQTAAVQPKNKQERFVSKFAASAIALEAKEGVPALFTLAQGAWESGWGEKAIGNALFGIKAGANWKGKKQLVVTTEVFNDDKQGDKFPEVISITKLDSGKYKYKVKDWFRDYDTVEEGLADHSRFLIDNKRYAGAFNTETPEAFARAVAAAGYATDPGYANSLVGMISSIKKYWPKDGSLVIPAGNAKAITGGKPGGADPAKPQTKPETKPAGGQTTPAAGKDAPAKGNTISGSVGEGGQNAAADAVIVKGLLIKAGYALTNSADVGPKTIGFIKDYQTKVLGWKNPDGLVEPGGGTFNALIKGQGPAVAKPTTGAAKPKATVSTTNYASMAEQLHRAMFATTMGMDLGTDEAAIYAVLGKLNHDATKINALKAAYKAAYQRDLAADLRSELSDSMLLGPELSKAIDLITPKASPAVKGESKTVTPPVKGGTNESKPSTQTAGSTGSKLDQFYNDFSNIKVTVGDKEVIITPPYHINDFDRVKRSNAARAAKPEVETMVKKLIKAGKVASGALVGKSQPADIKAILEQAITDGLTTHDGPSMVAFLSKYGLSVDCSGYVSQALNFLMDGNKTIDKNDKLQPGMTASGSLKGGTDNFDAVAIADLKSGDTMHLKGHIRIINEVVTEDKIVYFRTAESTGAVNGKTNMNGLMTRWWKYEGGKKYYTWENQSGAHPAHDHKSWKLSSETNTFGRYKSLAQ